MYVAYWWVPKCVSGDEDGQKSVRQTELCLSYKTEIPLLYLLKLLSLRLFSFHLDKR